MEKATSNRGYSFAAELLDSLIAGQITFRLGEKEIGERMTCEGDTCNCLRGTNTNCSISLPPLPKETPGRLPCWASRPFISLVPLYTGFIANGDLKDTEGYQRRRDCLYRYTHRHDHPTVIKAHEFTAMFVWYGYSNRWAKLCVILPRNEKGRADELLPWLPKWYRLQP